MNAVTPSPLVATAQEVGLLELTLYGRDDPRLYVRPEKIIGVEPSKAEFTVGADVHIEGVGTREVREKPARILTMLQRLKRLEEGAYPDRMPA